MTDQEINIAIAKELGYVFQGPPPHEPTESVIPPRGPLIMFRDIPDFCNDNKAMAEAERWLMNIDPESWDEYYCSFGLSRTLFTTRQRAEKFLKVLGK